MLHGSAVLALSFAESSLSIISELTSMLSAIMRSVRMGHKHTGCMMCMQRH